jgi:voltage-gated potassium channel Kch
MYEDEPKKLEVEVQRAHGSKRRIISPSIRRLRWIILAAAAVTAAACGFLGYRQQFGEGRLLDTVYYTIKLFGFSVERPADEHLNRSVEIARWVAPAVAASTALLALASLFRERFKEALVGLTWSDHYVVCGLGDKGLTFVRALRDAGRRVVVIESDANNQRIPAARNRGAVVVLGDARDANALSLVRVERARQLVTVTGDDGVNAEIVMVARDLHDSGKRRPLRCFVHMTNPDLALMLCAHRGDLSHTRSGITFENSLESGVRELLETHPGGEREASTHALVVGTDEFAGRVVSHLVRRWSSAHFGGIPTITIVGELAADQVMSSVHGGATPDLVRLRSSPAPTTALDRAHIDLEDAPPITIAYVCLGDDTSSLAAAISLRNGTVSPAVPIVATVSSTNGIARLLETDSARHRYGATTCFPILERTCDVEALDRDSIELVARQRHDGYVRERLAAGDTPHDNPSLVSWDRLPLDLRESNRDYARSILAKLDSLRCAIVPIRSWEFNEFRFTGDEIEQLSIDEHQRFVAERVRQGWVFAAGPKDSSARTSPTLIPWSDLSEEEREKDRAAARDIPRLLATLGWQIMRLDA